MPAGPAGGPELHPPQQRAAGAYRLFWKRIFEVELPRLQTANRYARATRLAARRRRA